MVNTSTEDISISEII